MDIVYNELSFSACYPEKNSARQGMVESIQAAKALIALGYTEEIRIVKNFSQLETAPGYAVHAWAIDKEVEPDFRRYFLTKCTRSPYLEDFHKEASIPGDIEYTYEGESALGLTMGYLWDTVTLSLGGDQRFQNFLVELTRESLVTKKNPDGSLVGVIIQKEPCPAHTVVNASMILQNKKTLKKKLLDKLACGEHILQQAEKYFPGLVFCDTAKKQIRALTGSEQYFQEIIEHFNTFDIEIHSGKHPFRPEGITYAVRESESTMSSQKCKQAREFICPDGIPRVFWAHSKLMSANQRIHIIPNLGEKNVFVGYVGLHLPLA